MSVSTSRSAIALPLLTRGQLQAGHRSESSLEGGLNAVAVRQVDVDRFANELCECPARAFGQGIQLRALFLGEIDLRACRCHIHRSIQHIGSWARGGRND